MNPWTLAEMLAAEKKALGFYITAHPLDDYSETISKLGASSSAAMASGMAAVGGFIVMGLLGTGLVSRVIGIYAFAIAATSAAKSSFFFSMPSPTTRKRYA